MAEIHGFKIMLPLPPPPGQLTREAQSAMEGYDPMTGLVGIEVSYLTAGHERIEYDVQQIIADLSGVVFEGLPDKDLIKTHVCEEGYVNPSVIIDVWQEGPK